MNAGDRENVHPHVNAQETARQDGIAHQDGPAGWFLVTQSSSLSSASMGESLSDFLAQTNVWLKSSWLELNSVFCATAPAVT